ncbi:MAG: hypothetical protein AAGE18_01900 [Pseudomonadota bacterium]
MGPREKKRASLSRDGRNDYGQSDKAARKAIPRNKAKANRRIRRAADSAAVVGETPPPRLAKSRWQKAPDRRLGAYIATQVRARENRVGGKARRHSAATSGGMS